MSLPNQLTVLRFVLAFVLFGLLMGTDVAAGPEWWPAVASAGLFMFAVFTDFLDGYLARKWEQVSVFGRIADPVADKVIVSGSLIFLVSSSWATHYLPVWVVVVILAREYLVTGLRGFIESRGVAFGASWDGKLKMISQCCLVPALFLTRGVDLAWGGEPAWLQGTLTVLAHLFVWLTLALSVLSAVRYVQAATRLLRPAPGDSPTA
ncbi:MAG: CDP-diacylglycerol--glycerol-3-phosphate 3-phosphatidyltransferase [Planctomycetota bacterium]|nr:MAG: CDP-diacylglycerol--glycerol-3-phosphate 3-phosphatidyltransferase [Planctomycetota bacterium]